MTYGSTKRFERTLPDMESTVREALAKEGFGILSEIDVAATLATKLNIERPPYKILGACNPRLAARALEVDPDIGLMLPCNVVLYAEDQNTVVSFVDPKAMLAMAGAEGLDPIAEEAATSLAAAFDSLGPGIPG